MQDGKQLNLFDAVTEAYAEAGDRPLDNAALYKRVIELTDLSEDDLQRTETLDKSGRSFRPGTRRVRWIQQTLKHMGIIQKVKDSRGLWVLTEDGRHQLRRARPGVKILGFSTQLGIAVFGNCEDIFSQLDIPITLCVTSAPYPLRKCRAYGNPTAEQYVDFICRTLEPVVKHLRPGGSICLNLSNDIFEQGLPARSNYRERVVLAMCERFGLYKMDEIIWCNPSKPPSPVQWASIHRNQLNAGWEPVYWFTNNPSRVIADNRRVLEPHTEQHKTFLAAGNRREAVYSDGAYRLRPTSFQNQTEGRIPRNVLTISHSCGDQREYKRAAREQGLPAHGAPFPLRMAEFLVKFLSDVNDLCVDPMAGSLTLAKASEVNNRLWVACDNILEHIAGAVNRFPGANRNPDFFRLVENRLRD